MDSPIETLKGLLIQKEKLMKEIESKISSLENDIFLCKNDLESLGHEWSGISQAIKAITPKGAPSQTAPAPSQASYAGMGLTDAIVEALRTVSSPGLTPTELASHLTNGGFVSTAKDFYMSVYGVCTGLVKRKRIREGMKDGRTSFMRISTPPPPLMVSEP